MLKRKISENAFSPRVKRQTTLSFTPQPHKEVTVVTTNGTDHFKLEDYVTQLIRKHGSDERYYEFFLRNNSEQISSKLRQYLTPSLLDVLDSHKEMDPAALTAIGGDMNIEGPGWYLNVLTDKEDLTWTALYIGQSNTVGKRVRYHKSHFRTAANSLHYFVWKQPKKMSVFVLLGHLPAGVEDEDLMLNVGEHVLGTILQALPEPMLSEYIPPGARVRQPHRGLMVARPICQGHRDPSKDSWMLWKSTNLLTLRYASTYYKESLNRGRQTQTQLQQAPQIVTKRAKSKKAHLFRDPVESLGDCKTVVRQCRICKTTQSIDPAPIYEISTGRYIARKAPCDRCQETAPGRLARSQNGRKTTYHIPVDSNVRYIRQEDIS